MEESKIPEEETSEKPQGCPFEELPLDETILDGLSSMGFKDATPIQAAAIPYIVEGRDLIGVAQTGTGKTAAFVLPTMHNIVRNGGDHVKVLIITPTRELAMQIDQAIEGFGYYAGISSVAVYGGGSGQDFDREKKALTTGVDIVIVTPGRLISHLNLGYVDFSKLDVLILDEADRMLDMGFLGDINRIAEHCSPKRQTLLFSATMPQRIHDLASKMLNDPKTIQIALSKPAEGVIQVAYPVHEDTKPQLLVHLLKDRDLKSVLVFSSRKRSVNIIARSLKKAGVNVGTISSDLEQKDREETLRNFRNRKITVLVATDVVSRGIDIDDIELVINYDVPPNEEDYVHRIGRTARASKSGMAITLIKPDEFRSFSKIEQLIGSEVRKLPMPAELGEGPTYDPNYRGSGRGWHGGGGGGRRNSGGGGRHGGGGGRKNGSGSGGNRSRSGGGGGDRNRRGGSAQ